MSLQIESSQVDIVIAAVRANLTSFFEEWRPIFSRFHIIIVKDPDLEEDLQIPQGFDHQVFTKSEIEKTVGGTSINFSGHYCRYFGYLVSRKKYIVSIDDDCLPAKDNSGALIDPVAQHLTNLQTPATPFFFNTLYDPYRKGADFVRGYPFSMREGVECVLSCGLWLNIADYDGPTRMVKTRDCNTRYVDAVMTVPLRAVMPVSGINLGFNKDVLGPIFSPALRLSGKGKTRCETMDDIWSGMCAKLICDHLGLGAKTGLPYVSRVEGVDKGLGAKNFNRELEEVKLMEEVLPFFQSAGLPKTAATTEDCVVAIAGMVREKLGAVNPRYVQVAGAMEEWVKLWKAVHSQGA